VLVGFFAWLAMSGFDCVCGSDFFGLLRSRALIAVRFLFPVWACGSCFISAVCCAFSASVGVLIYSY